GCKRHVQKTLESVDEIESVTINLEDGTAEINMTKGMINR
ncbi:MAG: copper chaperone CopZ, partial [Flavobacteriales bacterium]